MIDKFMRGTWASGLGAALLTAMPAAAEEPAYAVHADAVADISSTLEGDRTGSDFTGILRVNADLDLAAAAGWTGATLHAQGIASAGTRPNDRADTLQGVNNIEVPENRIKLFEFYLEQSLAASGSSLRIGFSDLNAEFYATESSATLIAPAFGIGSELSATGPNGPSLFPSTALTVRLHLQDRRGLYANLALVNAEAGVLGDRGGMRPLFGKGALTIGELGWSGKHKLAFGGWAYTSRQEDLRDADPVGAPLRRNAFGAYLLADVKLNGNVGLFARAGISDGKTSPYTGGWQAGVRLTGALPGRPDSILSTGINQAFLSGRFRANQFDAGTVLDGSETGIELTYSDAVLPHVNVQPDFQWVWKAARGEHAAIAALRIAVSY